jgi:hypothetical protein
MAFRADIVKMIEDLVTKIEDHHFKVNYTMKQDFVTFVNSFMKSHLDQTDINFTLNANLLYADTDGVKVIIAADSTMAFAVPGCTIPMRDQIEAFIVVDEVVAYDSYKMRRFRQAIQDSSSSVQNAAPAPAQIAATPAAPHNMFTPPAPAPAASTPATTTSSTPSATTQTPSSFNFSTPPATTPAPSSFNLSTFPANPPTSALSFPTTSTPAPSSFNFSTTPTTTSAFHLSTVPTAKTFSSPTNLFSSR